MKLLVTGGAIVPTIDYIGQLKEAKYYCFHWLVANAWLDELLSVHLAGIFLTVCGSSEFFSVFEMSRINETNCT